MIKNIIFDFGGVLLDWNPRYLYRQYFHDEAAMEWFLANVCTLQWNSLLDGGMPFDDAIPALQKEFPQFRQLIALYQTQWPQMVSGSIPLGVSMLHTYKKKGYKLYGLTNWSNETLSIELPLYDFFKLFDGMVVSGLEKVIKPQRRIYEILLERYSLNADESLFIDDSPANLAGAERVGLHTFLFDGKSVPDTI